MKILQIAFLLISIVLTSCSQNKYALKEIRTGDKYEMPKSIESPQLTDNKKPKQLLPEKIVEENKKNAKTIELIPVVKAQQAKEDVFAKTQKTIKKEIKKAAETVSKNIEKNKNTAQVNMPGWGKKLVLAIIFTAVGFFILFFGVFIAAIIESYALLIVATVLGILLLIAAFVFYIMFVIGLLNES